MPKKLMNGETSATVDEVIDLWKLGNLAQEWAAAYSVNDFPAPKLDAYRDLCAKYGVDGMVLLYLFQAMRDTPPPVIPAEQTSIFTAAGSIDSN